MNGKDITIIIVIVIIALAAGILSAIQYHDGVVAEKKAEDLSIKLQQSQDSLAASQKEIIDEQKKYNLKADQLAQANKDNFELSQELNKKSNAIIDSNSELINAQNEALKHARGDGHGVVEFFVKDGRLSSYFHNTSKYSLHGAQFKQMNWSEVKNCEHTVNDLGEITINDKCTETHSQKDGQRITIPSNIYQELNFTFPDFKELHLIYTLHFNHSVFTQYTILRITDDNRIESAYRLFRSIIDGPNETFEFIEESKLKLADEEYITNFPYLKVLKTLR